MKKKQKVLKKIKNHTINVLLRRGIKNRNEKMVTFAIRKGADINKKFLDGMVYTPIEYACEYGNNDIIKILLNAGCKLKYKDNALCYYLAARNKYKLLKALIKRGLDPNIRCGDRTGLHWAAQEGCLESAKVLLEEGADVNAMEEDGMTALYIASSEPHIEIVKLLLSYQAEVDLTGEGTTPLEIASIWGHYKVVKTLLEHGADVNYRDSEGRTPLFYVKVAQCKKSKSHEVYKAIEKLLLQYNADTDITDKYGITMQNLENPWICRKMYKELWG